MTCYVVKIVLLIVVASNSTAKNAISPFV